jgi:peptide/nickel transport system substrate-binding protein
MVHKEAVWKLVENYKAGRLSRRDFLVDAAAMGFSATAIAGALTATSMKAMPALAQDLKEVPREKIVVASRSAIAGKFDEAELWNPFIPAANHQLGSQLVFEPLAFYSAFEDKIILWLAESYEYAADYMSLTVKTRPNVTWSDGTAFSAEDVAYTFTHLVEIGSAVKWGANVQQFVETAVATDPNTVLFTFKVPAPRFFEFISYKFDIGVYIVPKHIFEGQDWTTFAHLDLANGLPVTTAPWRVVFTSSDQKVLDRTDSWWGVEAGVGKLPAPERFVYLPDPGEQGLATGIISNQYDITTGIQPATFPTVFDGSEQVTTWTGREEPFGNVDWWPHSLYLNNEVAPWDDPNVRWAISYYIDREQIIDVGWSGASSPSTLFVPDYPGLRPYVEAVADLIEQYPYYEYNPEKGDALLEAKGWTKEDDMWHDETGAQVTLEIISFFDFTGVGPVVVEQLKRAGIEATYAEPPDMFTRFSAGDYTGALFGHGGSYSGDVWYSLNLYQSASEKIPGGHLVNFSRWHNDEYDALVDELYGISPTETERVMEIWRKCMEIWLPANPDIQISQGLHRLPMNTTNWTNWPTAENPYVNPAHFHLTWGLVLHMLEPATPAS